jgi:hypothetical protein
MHPYPSIPIHTSLPIDNYPSIPTHPPILSHHPYYYPSIHHPYPSIPINASLSIDQCPPIHASLSTDPYPSSDHPINHPFNHQCIPFRQSITIHRSLLPSHQSIHYHPIPSIHPYFHPYTHSFSSIPIHVTNPSIPIHLFPINYYDHHDLYLPFCMMTRSNRSNTWIDAFDQVKHVDQTSTTTASYRTTHHALIHPSIDQLIESHESNRMMLNKQLLRRTSLDRGRECKVNRPTILQKMVRMM